MSTPSESLRLAKAMMRLKSLKEQDSLISMIQGFCAELPRTEEGFINVRGAFERAEGLINAHIAAKRENAGAPTELESLAPELSQIFHPLPLCRALDFFTHQVVVSARRFVPPSFSEIRRIIDAAVVFTMAQGVQLVTFDADETIYADGAELDADNPSCSMICELLGAGLHVALCTAAGYTDVARYEARLRGLLEKFERDGVSDETMARFAVMGGECNYLAVIRRDAPSGRVRLAMVPEESWKDGRGVRWRHEDVATLLDTAQAVLQESCARLGVPARTIRKERAVGMIGIGDESPRPTASEEGRLGWAGPRPGRHFTYEELEEIALCVQEALRDCTVPHCAFNGGNDVWVDVGNKALGIRALQAYFKVPSEWTVHFGDRFTKTGNDVKAREVANTIWIAGPRETWEFAALLLEQVAARTA